MNTKINYQLLLDNFIAAHPERIPLALHSCCAPCSSYVITYLAQFFDITVFFYNPNIHPAEEYERRKLEQMRLCSELGVDFIDCPYDSENYFTFVSGLENKPEGGARCEKCFYMRLAFVADEAKRRGFSLFATTLTVSPHKNAPLINEIGMAIAQEHGIEWLPSDFKKREGYKRSIELSRQYELYRQDYCGCIFSKREETQQ